MSLGLHEVFVVDELFVEVCCFESFGVCLEVLVRGGYWVEVDAVGVDPERHHHVAQQWLAGSDHASLVLDSLRDEFGLLEQVFHGSFVAVDETRDVVEQRDEVVVHASVELADLFVLFFELHVQRGHYRGDVFLRFVGHEGAWSAAATR